MSLTDESRQIPLLCYHSGVRKVLPLEVAHQLFWLVSLGLIPMLDFFRSGHGERAKKGSFTSTVQRGAPRFVMKLLTRGRLALAREDVCLQDENGDPPARPTFAVWAYECKKLFDDREILERTYFIDKDYHRQVGYRMKLDETWLVVIGVDPKSGLSDTAVDLSVFLDPPEDLDDSAVSAC